MRIPHQLQYNILINDFQNQCAVFVNYKQTCVRQLQTLFHFCKICLANIILNLCKTKQNLNIAIRKLIIIHIVYTTAKIAFVRNYTQRQR